MDNQSAPDGMDSTRAQLFGDEINVELLDSIMEAMHSNQSEARKQANMLLCELKMHPGSWLKVDTILEKSNLVQTKYFALQILEDLITTRWRTLPAEQRTGIRDFITVKINELATVDPKSTLLNKMNVVLVQILKKDWPRRWPMFVTEILELATRNKGMCINSMQIFSLLSEDVFDFGSQTMTQAEERYLKENFCRQFEEIFQFCLRCLIDCPTDEIVTSVLKTIRRFLTWIPTPTVFESSIIPLMTDKFLGMDNYRIYILQCLTEIAGIPVKNCEAYLPQIKSMFIAAVKQIAEYVGETPDFAQVYKASNSEHDRIFLSSLTNFLATFLKEYDTYLEENRESGDVEIHNYALILLIKLSLVDDIEMWKICLEYWLQLSSERYRANPYEHMDQKSLFPFHLGLTGGNSRIRNDSKTSFYDPILSQLRDVVISKMARPEEVTVVENDSGEVVREIMRDTDNINLYRSMKETLGYLTHLNNQDTMDKMTQRLTQQMTPDGFDRPQLNTLCWAIGSISNILQEDDEKRFLVVVIRDLLSLCEMKRGKDNKAAIAANIMYVVGQYHRFLRAHWKFLRTVVNKLFEFMHESHEGVQDMACDTFIKIVLKCKRHFVATQTGEAVPFLEDMLVNLSANTCDLTNEQQGVFYEAMGHIVAAVPNDDQRLVYLERLMAFINDTWDRCIRHISSQESPLGALIDIDISKEILHCVKISSSVCRSFGFLFHVQLTPKFSDMLAVYRLISTGLNSEDFSRVDIQIIKNVRAYKKEFLILMSTWIAQEDALDILKRDFFDPLMDAVLFDYQNNQPEARDSKVLSLLAIVVTRMEDEISPFVPAILDAVLTCTVEMITKDMTTYPEHRVNLFQLLLAMFTEVFNSLLCLPGDRLEFILEAIYWAFQNSQREVAELGLDITKEILDKISDMAVHGNSEGHRVSQAFYEQYFISILEHIFAVVADSNQVHIAGLTRYSEILCLMFNSLENAIVVPLNPDNPQTPNRDYVSEYLAKIFSKHYADHLNTEQIRVFIIGFFTFSTDVNLMKNHLKDFLVKLKELQDEHALDQDLFLAEREAAISDVMRTKPPDSRSSMSNS